MIGVGPCVQIGDPQAFQRLKTMLSRQIVDAIDFSKAADLADDDLRKQVTALALHVCSSDSVGLPVESRDPMVREILDEIYGFGPLQALMNDADVSEILVNGPESISAERGGTVQETDLRFADEAHLLQFVQRLLRQAGRQINERSPVVEAQLPDGTRLHAIIGPLAPRGPMLTIRRARTGSAQLENLVQRGTLAPEMAEFLAAAVGGRLNILVSGTANAGKTTLLNSLIRLIPPSERIVAIEQSAEFELPRRNAVSLEARSIDQRGNGQVSVRELLQNGLRMQPDRILVGEVRGDETLDLLQDMNAGYAGSMTTIAAGDPRDALARLELMISRSRNDLSTTAMRHTIASALHLLVHVARFASGERKIVRIAELCGYFDGEYVIEDLFVYRAAGTDERGRSLGTFYSTGYEPVFLGQLASLDLERAANLFVPKELGIASEMSASGTTEAWHN